MSEESVTLRPLTLPQRAFIALFRQAEKVLYGFSIPFIENLFRVRGYRGLFAMGNQLTTTMKSLDRRYGPLISNLVLALAGLWNGCRYCSTGHVYAVNLLYFKETGRLYPIAETEIPALQDLTYTEFMERLRTSLSANEFTEHLRIAETMFALLNGSPVNSDEDRLLSTALGCWAWLNECTIPVTYDLQVSDVPALLLKKDREAILSRYQAARKAAETSKNKEMDLA